MRSVTVKVLILLSYVVCATGRFSFKPHFNITLWPICFLYDHKPYPPLNWNNAKFWTRHLIAKYTIVRKINIGIRVG